MIAALALLGGLAVPGGAPVAAPAQEAWRAALEAGEYGRALELAEAEPGAVERARARVEVLFLGRDFAACLAAAEAGLAEAPGDLLLLHRAAGSALWLRDGVLAARYVDAIEAALPAAGLPAEHRAWWRDTAELYGVQAAELEAAREARADAAARARSTVLVLGTLAVGLLLLAAFRSGG